MDSFTQHLFFDKLKHILSDFKVAIRDPENQAPPDFLSEDLCS
jgi:hypothetical protein